VQVLKYFPLGITYAMWSGLGITLISIVGWAVFGQKLDLPAVARGYDAFANVLCLTPPETAARIDERMTINAAPGHPRAMSGVSRLPNGAGLMFRAVGVESYDVRAEVKRFWTVVREEARGRTLPDDFLWQ
jgi:urease accessory protein